MAFDERFSNQNVREEINELFASVGAAETDVTALEAAVLGNRAANLVYAAPASGAAAPASFRALVQADVPYTTVVTDATAALTIVLATLLNPRRLFVNMTNTGGPTVALPALSAPLIGLEITVFDGGGNATIAPIVVSPDGANTILGRTSIDADDGAIRFVAITATQWAGI